MTTVNYRGFRVFAIAALMAVGIVTTIATGGSSGGGDSGNGGFDGVTPPTLSITVANGSDVASAVIIAIGLSFDLGDITDANLLAGPGDIQLSAAGAKGAINFYKGLLQADQQALENCLNGGTKDVSITQANVNTLTVGDRIVAVFVDCDEGLGYVMSGTADITVAAVQGNILSDVFLVGMDVLLTDIVITEGTSIMTADGDFTLTLDSLLFPTLRMRLSGDALQLGSDGQVVTLTNFDHALEIDAGTMALVANVSGRLQSSTLGGSVDYETPVRIEAAGEEDPQFGEILITGADDSTVRIVIIDSTHIQLEIDENGDGTVDEFVDTTWDELNGRVSAITSQTAPILAREMYSAVTGFGSLTITAGTQFVPVAPFGLLGAMDVSGSFDALQIPCNLSGTATVSGFKSVTNTYINGDNLDATFAACRRGLEQLDGAMQFAVSAFDGAPGDAYVVSGSVVESGLQRVFLGYCFSGNGSFDTMHDFYLTTTGVIYSNSSAADFQVSSGGRSQQLTNAGVSAQITAGQPPSIVSRASSGVMTSGALNGSFGYLSIVPDEFVTDDDPMTGPYAGVMQVTAADNSSMRMVAIDAFNLRLDLDFDGDSVIDESIPTTWAALGSGLTCQ